MLFIRELTPCENVHTPLMCAALAGDTETVKTMLRRGASINLRDNEGRTALMFAVVNHHHATVEAILQFGADVNIQDCNGGTALMLAASGGDAEITQMLLNTGANFQACYVLTGKTAISLAAERGYSNIVELIERKTVLKIHNRGLEMAQLKAA